MKRVFCLGELLMRLAPPIGERVQEPPALERTFAGGEVGVAIAMARLGLPTAFVTRLPANAIGDAALRSLQSAGVDTAHVLRGGPRLGVEYSADEDDTPGIDDRAGSSFSLLDPNDLEWDGLLRDAGWLHASGMMPALGEGPWCSLQNALAAAGRAGVPRSLDLAWQPTIWGAREPTHLVRPLATDAELVVADAEAIARMLGVPGEDAGTDSLDALRDTARRVSSELAIERIAIVRGDTVAPGAEWSAVLYEREADALHVSRHAHTPVSDRAERRDAFIAGLVHAVLAGQSSAAALEAAMSATAPATRG